jgi:hypothetical protein
VHTIFSKTPKKKKSVDFIHLEFYYIMWIEKVKNVVQKSMVWQSLGKEGFAFYAFRSAAKKKNI